MELKEEYKNINIKNLLMKAFENGKFERTNGKLEKRHLEQMDKSLKLIKQNNWEKTYIAIYYLLDEMSKKNIRLSIKSVKGGVISSILDISIIVFVSLNINDNGKFKGLTMGETRDNYNKDTVIIETSEKETVSEILDTICIDWKDTFIFKDEELKKFYEEVEKNV